MVYLIMTGAIDNYRLHKNKPPIRGAIYNYRLHKENHPYND